MSNRSILEKADLALADLTTDGGVLQPAQAQRFIRILIDKSVIMGLSTVTPMRSPKQLIEKIRFASRILRSGSEATALPQGDRAKPDLSKVELDAKLFKAEVRLSDEVLEDSIERDQLKNTIMQLMSESIARDMDEVIVQGDTASADSFLAQFDGMLKAATSNVVIGGGVAINKGHFKNMLKTMPSEFLRRKMDMRYLTSVDARIDYADAVADRATALGDKALENDTNPQYSGVPILDVPLFPENLGGGTDETNIILTDPKNVNVGIWRRIKIETDKLVSEGVLLIVATMRFDFKYQEETAVVKATGIKVG
jgi:hypothetical protein